MGDLTYQNGIDHEFESEALEGALPVGQNSPQKGPYGLYSELISGAAFAAPRALNRRSYVFRTRPSAHPGDFEIIDHGDFRTPPLDLPPYPAGLRWAPLDDGCDGPIDFLQSITTLCGGGSPTQQAGLAIHLYRANRSMTSAFSNSDGEMLIIPFAGDLHIVTEFGNLNLEPKEFAVIPRGIKFRVELAGPMARGCVVENYGHHLTLPDLGLIGSNGLANVADFKTPVASFETVEEPTTLIHKYCGRLWRTELTHSPFNVVAWRGTLAPYKYDMRRFMAIGTVTHDHLDPSVYLALTSPSHPVMGCNLDLMILPPRWQISEHTFPAPGFHRNAVTEFSGIVSGKADTRAEGNGPGVLNLSNNWVPHGPDVKTFGMGREKALDPFHIEETTIFLLETRYPLELTQLALDLKERIRDCNKVWTGFPNSLQT